MLHSASAQWSVNMAESTEGPYSFHFYCEIKDAGFTIPKDGIYRCDSLIYDDEDYRQLKLELIERYGARRGSTVTILSLTRLA